MVREADERGGVFLVLEKTALYNTNLKTTDAIAENLKQGINYLNDHPRPYRWTKTVLI